MQVLGNSLSPVIIILHLQCSQVLHKLRSKRVPCSISVQEQRLKLIAVCILNGLVNQVSDEGFREKKWGMTIYR